MSAKSADTKNCTKCRLEKPADERHFALDKRSGRLNAACRDCSNAQARNRPGRRRSLDGLSGEVGATCAAVKKAFRERDADGSEGLEFRRRMSGVVVRFREMPFTEKVRQALWFLQEFLGARTTPVGRARNPKHEPSDATERS